MAKGKKERKKKKRKKKRYILKFTLFVAACVGLYFFLTSNIFDIQKIKVENNSHYTKMQIVEMAGAKAGQNLFEISSGKMKEKLLKDPYIESVKVRKVLPATIKIIVAERKPYAVIPYGDKFILIDKNAVVLEKVSGQPQLPLLLGMTLKNIEPGTVLKVEESAVLTDTLTLLDQMAQYDLYFKKIDISNVIIKAYVYDQFICEGTPDNILGNMKSIQSMIYDLYTKGIQRGVIKIGSNGYCAFSLIVE